jgi:hypothetical protein
VLSGPERLEPLRAIDLERWLLVRSTTQGSVKGQQM